MIIKNIFRSALSALRPAPGVLTHAEQSDRVIDDPARGITPDRVDAIMSAADGGDVRDQALLSMILAERDHTAGHALETRRNALLGVPWHVDAAGERAEDKRAAELLEKQLRNCGDGRDVDGFYQLIGGLFSALLPGYAVAEIVWTPGGGLDGFQTLPAEALTLADSQVPRLVTLAEPRGVELPPNKFIIAVRSRSGDPARGGLIRPLAWLYCFGQVGVKDMLAFVERFGMPFLLTKVNETTYNDAARMSRLKRLVRSFGPCGGGIFTEAVQAELLQAANTSGDVYFRLLEYLDAAKTKVILGQTASSSAGGGLSNDGEQGKVRQDILESDAAWVASVLQGQLLPVWTRLNFGDAAQVPRLVFDAAPPEDVVRHNQALQSRYEAMGIAVRAGVLTPTAEIESDVRRELKLPEMSGAAAAAWDDSKGVRLPVTLQSALGSGGGAGTPGAALSLERSAAGAPASPGPDDTALKAFDAFVAPLLGDVDAILAMADKDGALRLLQKKLPGLTGTADVDRLAAYMERSINGALKAGGGNGGK
ncbi:MAG: DUF935 family protein [Victivallaceae bacterium]|nr:DUF935 family protein [Victivallaceae bacterium]